MAETEPLESDTPLRPVDGEDLARVWRLIRKVITDHGKGVGIDARMISQQCSPGVDVNAVFFRAALLQHLFESGLLNPWREGDEPALSVFQVGAVFPIEQGVQGFDRKFYRAVALGKIVPLPFLLTDRKKIPRHDHDPNAPRGEAMFDWSVSFRYAHSGTRRSGKPVIRIYSGNRGEEIDCGVRPSASAR